MAGGGFKKAESRRSRAALLYGGLTLLFNVVFFATRWGFLPWLGAGSPLSRREWTCVLFLGGCSVLSLMSLVSSAEVGVTPEASLDLFALAAVVQLGSLYSPRAWWLLAIIPAYALYSSWGLIAGLRATGSGKPAEGAAAGTGTGAGAGAGAGASEEEMAAKRKRRQEHKEKMRGPAVQRRA